MHRLSPLGLALFVFLYVALLLHFVLPLHHLLMLLFLLVLADMHDRVRNSFFHFEKCREVLGYSLVDVYFCEDQL
jgi:hypothetical protein